MEELIEETYSSGRQSTRRSIPGGGGAVGNHSISTTDANNNNTDDDNSQAHLLAGGAADVVVVNLVHEKEQILESVRDYFVSTCSSYSGDPFVEKSEFGPIVALCHQPLFLTSSLWRFMTEDWLCDDLQSRHGKYRHVSHRRLSLDRFQSRWNTLISLSKGDYDSIFYHILLGTHPQLKSLSGESFDPLLEDVINLHPELAFLRGNTQFESKFIETVTTRIFFSTSMSPPPLDVDIIDGRCRGITSLQLRKSGLRRIVVDLPDMPINQETLFFSYKHFFVLYCKYFDLELGNGTRINSDTMVKYECASINPIARQRICAGCGLSPAWRSQKDGVFSVRSHYYNARSLRSNSDSGVDLSLQTDLSSDSQRVLGSVNYPDFIWFVLAEEDRTFPASLEYWFRILDTDDDGVLSLFELESFWNEHELWLTSEQASIEFNDIVCLVLDITKRKERDTNSQATGQYRDSGLALTKADIKRNPQSSARLFDYFINWRKTLERENTNGNRLHRENDEVQQAYFQNLQFMPAPAAGEDRSTAYASSSIPTDGKTPWARWADMEYDNYILQEEIEKRRSQLLSTSISGGLVGSDLGSDLNTPWLSVQSEESRLGDNDVSWFGSFGQYAAGVISPLETGGLGSGRKKSPSRGRKSKKWSKKRQSKSLSTSFKIRVGSAKGTESSLENSLDDSHLALQTVYEDAERLNSESISGSKAKMVRSDDDEIEAEEDSTSASSSEEEDDDEDELLSGGDFLAMHEKIAIFRDDVDGNCWANMDPNEPVALSPTGKTLETDSEMSERDYNLSETTFTNVEVCSSGVYSENSGSPLGTANREHPRLSRQLSPKSTDGKPKSPIQQHSRFPVPAVQIEDGRRDSDVELVQDCDEVD